MKNSIKEKWLWLGRNVLMLCMLLILANTGTAQIVLFNDTMQPSTPELTAELAQFTTHSASLDEKIEELRKLAMPAVRFRPVKKTWWLSYCASCN